MPWTKVMSKWKRGTLHSGSKSGPKVTSQDQAIAIMLSEKREAAKGKEEYQETDDDRKKRRKAESMLGKGARMAPRR